MAKHLMKKEQLTYINNNLYFFQNPLQNARGFCFMEFFCNFSNFDEIELKRYIIL